MRGRAQYLLGAFFGILFAALLTACGGGGGGASVPQSVQPQSTATPPPSTTTSLGSNGGNATLPASGSVTSGSVAFPANAALAGVNVTFKASQSGPTPQSIGHKTLSASAIAVYVMTFSGSVQNGVALGTVTVTFPGSTTGLTLEVFDNNTLAFSCFETAGNGSMTFTCSNVRLNLGDTYYMELVSGSSITPTPSPTPTPTPTPSAAGSAATLPPISYYTSSGHNVAFAPYAVANAFQFPVQSGWNGTGVTVAIVGDDAPSTSDIQAYLAQFGIAQTTSYSVVSVDGGPGVDSAGLGEATLDVETVSGLAPGAKILFYAMPNLSGTSFLDAYNQIVSDQHSSGAPTVASVSFGGCEVAGVDDTTFDPVFAQAATQGIAFFASTGDQGDECYNGSFVFGPNFPASDPNVIAVGGTETAAIGCGPGTIASQVTWNDTCGAGHLQEATGGGVSTLFALPSFQSGYGLSATKRNLPDIALPAVYDAVYQAGQGGWGPVGGTSWSAPQAAAMMAEIYEYCNTTIQNPIDVFYYAYAHAAADFLDVTSGNNRFGADSTYYTAGTGFDNTSGLGIPLGMAILQTICPNRVLVSMNRAQPQSIGSATLAPAVPTVIRNVPDFRSLSDAGKRQQNALTRIALVLRNTATIAQDEQVVVDSMRSAGFTIVKTYANHLVIDAEAPSSIVSRYFATEFHDFVQNRYGTRYSNVNPVVVPAAISPYVQGVIANNLIKAVPLSHNVKVKLLSH